MKSNFVCHKCKMVNPELAGSIKIENNTYDLCRGCQILWLTNLANVEQLYENLKNDFFQPERLSEKTSKEDAIV